MRYIVRIEVEVEADNEDAAIDWALDGQILSSHVDSVIEVGE